MDPTKVTVGEVKKQLEHGEPVVFIDTRNPKAWATSAVKLPGALRIPAEEVERHLSAIPHGRPIVTYCT
jgi:rhodanese-related sulfurtransferase